MKDSASSSWLTAKAVTGGANSNREARGAGGPDLQEAAQNWPTARAEDAESAGMRHSRGTADMLTAVSSQWKTLRTVAGDYTRDGGQKGMERLTLEGQASQMWATPASGLPNYDEPMETFQARGEALQQRGYPKQGANLGQQAQLWATPDTPGGGRSLPPGTSAAGQTPDGKKVTIGLENQSKMWPTPASLDHKGENSADHLQNGTGRLHMDQLPNAVAHGFSHPVQTIMPLGKPSWPQRTAILRLLWASMTSWHGRSVAKRLFKKRRTRRLNPLFVSWLMGWPKGHALCACSATEFAHWQQRMRGALSALPTASAGWIWEPPAKTKKPKQMGFDL